jgi:pyruvate dehydrogenase E2 component (dihydrolipoamide acetyltransferase)
MATKVHMEALSPTMEEGQVVKWLKSEGDEVSNGDVLAEVETDKATMELVARGDGVLRAIFLAEGGTAPVGDVIGVIAAADEDISGIAPTASAGGSTEEASATPTPDPSPPADAPAPAQASAPAPAAAPAGRPTSANGRIKASPVARRLARDAAIDLASILGSGPGGRIVKADVEAALAAGPAAPSAPVGAPASMPVPVMALDGPEYEDVPLSQIRKTIARRLSESLGPVPTFFLNIHVDMSRLMEARKRINEMLAAQGDKVSINDMIVKATAIALTQHPAVNAHWGGDHIRLHNRVHVAVAVAIPDGLITPVIRDANLKGLAQIGREVRDMAGRAREKKLLPEEYTGSTFSVSNLGMFGIHEFTALINPPEAGILAIGGVEHVPVVVDGELKTEPRMTITMSCDHRTIDGATGSRFLQSLKAMLEDPVVMMV